MFMVKTGTVVMRTQRFLGEPQVPVDLLVKATKLFRVFVFATRKWTKVPDKVPAAASLVSLVQLVPF